MGKTMGIAWNVMTCRCNIVVPWFDKELTCSNPISVSLRTYQDMDDIISFLMMYVQPIGPQNNEVMGLEKLALKQSST